MAKLPVLKAFLAQDYLSAGPWIGKFLYTLNLFTGTIYSSLNNGLTVQDNMLAVVSTQTLKGSNPTTTFKWPYATLPVGVVLWNITDVSTVPAPITTATTIQWSAGGGTVIISNITGLDTTRMYSCTFCASGG